MGLQFRRGIDSDRTGVTPSAGEPLFTTDTKKLYIGDGSTAGGILISGDVSDSAGVTVVINQVVDSAYVQARQTDFFRDSAFVTDIVDAAYIQARDRIRDSGFVEDIVDSAYVQARQDFAYSSLTGAPTTVSSFTNDANYLDSTTVTGVIDATYIQSNQTTYSTADFTDSAFVTGLPVSTFTNDANYLDSTTVTGVIDATYIQANQTTYDFLDSTEAIALIDSAHVQARQITYNTSDFTDSAFVTGLPVSTFTNDANYLDSTTVTNVIDAAYIQANQITYNTSDFADSAFVTAQINALIDGAPTTLDTLNEIAAALNDDDSAYATLVNLIGTKTDFDSADAIAVIDSAYVNGIITGSDLDMGGNRVLFANMYDSVGALPSATTYHGMFAHVHGTGAAYYAHAGSWVQLANYSQLSTYGDANVISLVDSAYVQARTVAGTDSAATIALITSTVDSAYVALREANAGGSGGTDSATVITLVQSTVDSDYVLARIPDATLQGVNQFEFLADSGQTVFTGADRDGNSLSYNATDVLVFLNGTLMVPGNDFNTTSSSTITFTEGVDSGDFVNIFNFTAGRAVGGGVSEVNHFDFTADSGQTAFTGADDNGSILSFIGNDNIQVFINGILLKQSDYTISNNNTVTLTDGADSADEVRIIAYDTYSQRVAIDTYNFTADSGQTVFTGLADDGNTLVFSPGNLQVHLNGIMLRSGNDFSTSGTGTVTLVSGADSGDTLTVTAISGDSAGYATIVPAIVDSAYINARVTIPAAGTDSADVVNIITAEGFTKYDSDDTIGLVDSAYISARFPTGGSSTVILPVAFAFVDNLSGSGTGLSWGNWNSGNYTLDFTFTVAQPNANYAIMTDCDVFDDYSVGITNKTTTGFRAEFYSGAVGRTPSSFSPFTFLIYGSNPQQRIAGFAGSYLDSSSTIGLIDSAYVQARQLTYSNADFADSAFVTAQINALIDGAPGTLDTLNEIAAALNDDDSAYATLVTLIGTKSDLDSADAINLIDSAYVQARQDYAYSSLTGAPTNVSSFTNDANYLDSTTVTGVIDAAYIQANQITYNTSDFTDSAFVTGLPVSTFTNDANYLDSTTVTGVIDATYIQANQTTYDFLDSAEAIALIATQGYLTDAIDSARITSMLASDSFSIGGTIIGDGKIEIKNTTGSTPSFVDLYCEVNNAHYTRIQSQAHANYSGNITLTTPNASGTLALTSDVVDSAAIITLIQANDQQRDSAFVTGIIDSAYIAARTSAGTDSASVIALITSTVDSAYVALREANSGGGGSVDSAAIISLIQATVDSAYVTARDPGGSGGVTFKTFQFAADSGQTAFTGTDDLGNSLAFVPDQYQVYRNGILLIDSDDYNGTGGGTITLTDTSVLGDQITIATYTATVGSSINTYDYFADSGQTSFSGADIDGNTLSFTGSNVLVHVNGLLLTDSNDYTRVGGSTITFDNGLDSGDVVSIIAVTDAVTSSGTDSATVVTLIQGTVDSAYIAARSAPGTDSATVVTLIEGTVDSAYIAARSAPGTDSATVQSIIQGLVDSAYVQARQSFTTGLLVDTYSYTADSAQTVFSGADNATNTLTYIAGEIQVFRNGILLVDSDDYTATNGTTVTLTSAANLSDNISITAFKSADQIVQINAFEYTADSAQTVFAGADANNNTLSYNVGNILVHLNGILLSDSADYTATNGTSITLATGADLNDILHISSFGTATALNKWRSTAVSYTVDAGTKLIVDTSSGAVTVTLPTSPIFGDEVKVIDGTGNAGTNNITINRNSNKILGADSDFTLDVNRAAVDLVYYNAAQGWIVSGNS